MLCWVRGIACHNGGFPLIADNPNFVFRNGNIGVWTSREFDVDSVKGKTDNVYDVNGDQADRAVARFTYFTGRVEIFSLGGQGFYVYSPNSFQTPLLLRQTHCEAYTDSWQSWGNDVPIEWFADGLFLMLPSTNYWHNHEWWTKGWHTQVSLQNNGAQSVVNTLMHIPQDVQDFRNPNDNCQRHFFATQTENTPSVGPGQTWISTLEDFFGWDQAARKQMEGVLKITSNPTIPGTFPTASVTPLPGAGTVVCSQNDLFLTT